MAGREDIVAIGFLTRSDLEGIGSALKYVIPVEECDFSDLLAQIDAAEERSKAKRDQG